MVKIDSVEALKKIARSQAKEQNKSGYKIAKDSGVGLHAVYNFMKKDVDVVLSNAIKMCAELGIKLYAEIEK